MEREMNTAGERDNARQSKTSSRPGQARPAGRRRPCFSVRECNHSTLLQQREGRHKHERIGLTRSRLTHPHTDTHSTQLSPTHITHRQQHQPRIPAASPSVCLLGMHGDSLTASSCTYISRPDLPLLLRLAAQACLRHITRSAHVSPHRITLAQLTSSHHIRVASLA